MQDHISHYFGKEIKELQNQIQELEAIKSFEATAYGS